jgi:hypothetical protein
MTHNLAWFLVGGLVSWFIYCEVDRYAMRPRDNSATWNKADRESAPWLQNSFGRKIGPIIVYTPPGITHASAIVYPAYSNGAPGFGLHDHDKNGIAEDYLITDTNGLYVCLTDVDADGSFDNFTYSTGFGPDSCSMDDQNMDGIFDQKLGPGDILFVKIDGAWHELLHDGNESFVMIDEVRTPVIQESNVWTLAVATTTEGIDK